ncbi:MAG: energy-dependent translational throttle protein EttA [Acidobacteriota bacterium]|nr:energy-dependent translational throttle protein EttA [Acidobacteriota bacterium]MDE3030807.1 energy-dependent translational throttle protein EttA [Acidobacteriota bacterium]MDE3092542.1 energy-dependent translational throttle protein EttA [Acidobacteriota bacterium]MDE3138375.1 energy-dependent translational throttle protein EttA [Acidobacteriota bacterium]MDE3147617.1 energy-dependent translational throttle protein EttA [Acidobacteriota bacterium]
MAAQFIFTMRDLRRFYPPDREVLKGINLSFYPGAKIGVIGSNGSGKSSLLRIMAGLDDGFSGEARLTPGFTVGYLPQEPQLDPDKDVVGNVADGVAEQRDLLARFNEVCASFADPDADFDALLAEQSTLQTRIDALGAWDLERTLEIAMDALRLPPSDADVTKLSGGERRRVALCRLLLSHPDLLLLDEPTNHLDAESVAWLERTLQDYSGTVVAITHDRYFLDNAASWILELDRGHGIPWEGNYSSWLEQKQARLAGEEKADKARQAALERELEWIRMSPRARQSKGKARLSAFNELVAESEAAERRADKLEIAIPPGPRLGDVVVNASHLTKAYDDRLLIEDLDFLLPPGGIVGVIGANGAGKTTLFKMMVGLEQPTSGTIEVGSTVQFAYVDQSRDSLDAAATVFDEISGGQEHMVVGSREVHARAYVASFGFKGSDQQKKVGEISGGERNRVQLAKVLRTGGNVLLLDEPTNDLDVDTLRALEDGLLTFPGCVVVISHDRWFLDRIATHVLAFEGDAVVRWFEGNFSDYEAERHKRLGTDADQPHRIRYKPLTR